MRVTHIRLGTGNIKDLDFDSWEEHLSKAWQRKADKIQARRWRKLRHELKGSQYIDYKTNKRGGIL